MIKGIKSLLLKLYVVLCRLIYGVDNNKVLFTSFNGTVYSDNPKAISEQVHALAPTINIYWVLPDKYTAETPCYIKKIANNNKYRLFKEIATTKVFVSNFAFPDIPKGKKQFFIQTWHGDRGFKKMLYDAPDQIPGFYVAESKEGYCDLALAGSEFGEKAYRSAFKYNGRVLKVGCPRNDCLVHANKDRINQIKKKLKIDLATGVLLYAPTLRQKTQKANQIQVVDGIDVERTLQALRMKYSSEWICLIRSHPGIIGLGGYNDKTESVLDVSKYPDMADLLLISDVLITDYSSSAGDFALLHRPIFLYQPDVEEFLQKERSMYFELDSSPFIICKSQDDLDNSILNSTEDNVIKNCDEILQFYGTKETGKASIIVSDTIASIIQSV